MFDIEPCISECPICFECMQLVTVLPCRHMFCYSCAVRASLEFGMACALCKQIVCGITPNKMREDVALDVGNGRYAGVTLTNDIHGVRVQKLHPKDEARSVLSVKDVITSINGLPTVHHRDAVAAINAATTAAIRISFSIYQRGDTTAQVKRERYSAQAYHGSI